MTQREYYLEQAERYLSAAVERLGNNTSIDQQIHIAEVYAILALSVSNQAVRPAAIADMVERLLHPPAVAHFGTPVPAFQGPSGPEGASRPLEP